MKVKKVFFKSLLVSLFLIIVATILGYLYLRTRRAAGEGERFEKILDRTDYDLSLGYSDKAFDVLQNALELAHSEYSLLRVLKRAFALSDSQRDYTKFAVLARRAFQKIPGSTAIRGLVIYAGLRTGKGLSEQEKEELNKYSFRPRGSDETTQEWFQYLRAEAFFLSERGIDIRQESISPLLQSLISLNHLIEPTRIEKAGKEWQDERLLLDAAILWMKEGRPERAFEIIKNNLNKEKYDEPAVFIAFDAGRLEEAERRLKRVISIKPERTDLILLLADVYSLMKHDEQAQFYYHRTITAGPDFSWKPYLNLAALLEEDQDFEAAYLYLEKAFRNFPAEKEVILVYADSLTKRGEKKQALAVLESFLKKHPRDSDANLKYLELSNSSGSPTVYQARLWNQYNLFPENEYLCKTLTTYLLEFGDLQGAKTALRQFEINAGISDASWLLHFKGIVAALEENYLAASELLKKSLSGQDNWQVRYNLALVLKTDRKFSPALTELRKAENLLLEKTFAPEQNKYRSLMRSRLGEIYFSQGDIVSAKRELKYSLDLNPENLHSRLLLKNLEEAQKK